ncbi:MULTISPECIES: SDR family oxidoreductase [Spongiibacter]|uniref:SDR family oxidoreductase n=1 Tax=Spongiibacter TaxID=630749 RepID=UPI0023552938|nr:MULTISPECIES: SDR family oxidoreductase [Spongiibacter]|tara:strand:+ start:612 stop:1352 length:741 start_codon:yes stop_codon:yes gene_type:complete
MSFNDKVVVITGAGQGIGEGYAKRCATEGMKVVVAELNSEQGERVVAEIREQGGEAMFVRTDVGNEESCIACANAAKEAFGQIDYLINNAAIFGNMKIEGYMNVEMDYLETFMRVNVHGSLLMARACVPHMPKGSAIVNQSSTAAWMNMGFYGVAKLALNGLTCSLARELGWRKIRINAIAPGPTETQALRNTAGDYADELVKQMPLSRLGTPDDMADAALFLLSEQASWITGHILNVDGGQFMRV